MAFDITPYMYKSPAEVRAAIRAGEIDFPTAGMCRGYAQANLIILPPEYAADFEEIAKRLTNITTRGIVFKEKHDLQSVFEERLPLYEKYADITVRCTGADIEACVKELMEVLISGKGHIDGTH